MAGSNGGTGSSTTFFGVVSRSAPRGVTAKLLAPSTGNVQVEARAPSAVTGRPVPPPPAPTVRPSSPSKP